VDFLVSIHNLHSQAAVAKLGAVREGVLRNRWQLPSGSVVDAVSYSVVPGDWAGVKGGLEARVGGVPPLTSRQ
jgi:RimJ/RimL family protein N-acetyltransferase